MILFTGRMLMVVLNTAKWYQVAATVTVYVERSNSYIQGWRNRE